MKTKKTLGELAEDITVGYVGSMASEYLEKGVPFLRSLNVRPYRFDPNEIKYISKSFHEKISKSALKPGDVVSVRTGNPGVSCVIPDDLPEANCSDLVVIRCGDKLDPYFVSYYLNFVTSSHIKNQLVGAIQQHFNIGSAKELPFPDLNKDQQIELSTVIRVINKKIELNNKINAELEAMAKLIYDYWFVQFDFPDVNGKPYKSSGGEMVYNEALKREIPKGWGIKELSDIAAIKAGGDKPKIFSTEISENCTIPIYSNGIERYGLYGYTDSAKISSPSITISARGTIGICFLRMKPFFPIIRLIVITPSNQNYLKYLDEYLATVDFEYSGSVQRQLTVPQVGRMKIVCPTDELLEKYAVLVSSSIREIEILKEQNHELSELRDWLLPMLMNGQVTVKGTHHSKKGKLKHGSSIL